MNLIYQFNRGLKTVFFIPMVIFLILINVLVLKWDPSFKNLTTTELTNISIIEGLIQEKAKLQKKLEEVCNSKNLVPDNQSSFNPSPTYIAEFEPKDIEKNNNKVVTKTQTKAQYAS